MSTTRYIVVTGASGSGKSSFVALLRALVKNSLTLNEVIDFPVRYTTRTARNTEDAVETTNLSRFDFEARVETGLIPIWWQRELTSAWHTPEFYGFGNSVAQTQILSANQAFFSMPQIRLATVLCQAEIVEIRCPDHIRQQRITSRSPEMKVHEVDARLSEKPGSFYREANYVVENEAYGLEQITDNAIKYLRTLSIRSGVLDAAQPFMFPEKGLPSKKMSGL